MKRSLNISHPACKNRISLLVFISMRLAKTLHELPINQIQTGCKHSHSIPSSTRIQEPNILIWLFYHRLDFRITWHQRKYMQKNRQASTIGVILPVINKDTACRLDLQVLQHIHIEVRIRLPFSCIDSSSSSHFWKVKIGHRIATENAKQELSAWFFIFLTGTTFESISSHTDG